MKYGLRYWDEDHDCNPPEPNKSWITIGPLEEDGTVQEEMAIIVCRDLARMELEHPELVQRKIFYAQHIVNALNQLEDDQ